jgi:ankyrin repeat protein
MDKISAFFDAIQNGNRASAEELLASDPSLLMARSQGLSPVLAAAYYQEPEIAAWLVEMGAPLDIFEACAAGAAARVEQLLDQDPGLLNAFAADGFQPLGLASFFGHSNLVKLLLERGAEPSTPSRNGMGVTPLHSAAAGRHLEIARLLVDAGADVNARSGEGFTPLHSAAQNGQAELVRLLLNYGADPHAAADGGKTPADLARDKGHETITSMLS